MVDLWACTSIRPVEDTVSEYSWRSPLECPLGINCVKVSALLDLNQHERQSYYERALNERKQALRRYVIADSPTI